MYAGIASGSVAQDAYTWSIPTDVNYKGHYLGETDVFGDLITASYRYLDRLSGDIDKIDEYDDGDSHPKLPPEYVVLLRQATQNGAIVLQPQLAEHLGITIPIAPKGLRPTSVFVVDIAKYLESRNKKS